MLPSGVTTLEVASTLFLENTRRTRPESTSNDPRKDIAANTVKPSVQTSAMHPTRCDLANATAMAEPVRAQTAV
jgi:hypothetical protein